MARLVPYLLAAAAAVLMAAPLGHGATGEVKFCGPPRHGWQIAAGNYPEGGFPETGCGFAKATYRAARDRGGSLSELPGRLRLDVNGVELRCRTKSKSSYAELRCAERKHFVLIYKFFR